MDGILALIFLALLAVPVSIIVLFVGQSGLKRRVAVLEAELRARPAGAPLPGLAVAAAEPLAELAADIPAETGPETPPEPQPEAEPEAAPGWDRAARKADAEPRSPGAGARLALWLRENWVYAVSAASLALAGVFFVQYGIEKGLLPPAARVGAALLFGLALIGAGEVLRRRQGRSGDSGSTAYLPAVFSGAGVVSVFAAIVAARQLYGLIGAETAFGGLMVTAAGAVALGWVSGPLLVVVGLLGAAAAPFLVGGNGAGPWLYGYYGLIAAAGLAVDTVRRWRWLAVLALVLGFGGAWAMQAAGAGVPGMLVFLTLMPVAALMLAEFALIPRQGGPALWQVMASNGAAGRLPFGVLLAHGAVGAASLGLLAQGGGPTEAILAFAALAALAVLLLLWADRAAGLVDLALWPALGFVARLLLEPLQWGAAYGAFRGQEIALRAPEVGPPATVSLLLGLAVAVSAAAALRALRTAERPLALGFGLAAVLVAPVTAAGLELLWRPVPVIGAYPWALQVIALAAAMVLLAQRFARADAPDLRRAAHATLSALSLIALALFLVTTKTALTLALAVLAVVAAALDRRLRLPEMGLFVQVAVAVLSWRLLVDPGLDWAMTAPLAEVLLAFGGTMAGLAAAWVLLRPLGRTITCGVLESAVAGHAAILVNLLLTRWIEGMAQPGMLVAPWSVTLQALPWAVLAAVQLHRAGFGGALRRVRLILAALAGGLAALLLGAALTVSNPLIPGFGPEPARLVYGPQPFDTLMLAYGVPGLLLLAAALRLRAMGDWPRLRRVVLWGGAGLLAFWVALEIRRFWQGDWLGVPGVRQEELYSYTVALILLGAGLLYQSLARRSVPLRRVAMAVIALAAAKVFLIDASGLTGLTRVLSFLGLGLSLAGLAWLNRWAAGRHQAP